MLEYNRPSKFKFIHTTYVSDSLLVLKNVSYHKGDGTTHTPPHHLYSLFQHDRLDEIGKVKFSIVTNQDQEEMGLGEFYLEFDIPKPDQILYHICMCLKQIARNYNMRFFYLLLPENVSFADGEQEQLQASLHRIDGQEFYQIPVESL